jgi:hypothetical protein
MKKFYSLFFFLIAFYLKGNSQNVGVGTASPASKLEIRGDSGDENSTGTLRLTNSTGTTNLRLGTLDGSRSWIQSHASLPLHINRLGNNVVFNETAGNVGIGVTSPAYKLDVAGDVNLTGKIRLSGTATANKVLKTDGSGNPVWGDDNNTTYTAGSGITISGTTITNASPSLWTNSGSNLYPNSTSWNVGIGNTAASEKLHVAGNIRLGGGYSINSEGDHIKLMNGVRADDSSYEWVGFYSGTTRQGIILYDGAWSGANSLTNEFSISAENGNMLTLNTQANNHIALMPKGTGNVGINTTAPASKLDLNNGSLRFSGTYEGAGQIQSTATVRFANSSSAQGVYAKQISLSDSWADNDSYTQTNGIYSKGNLRVGGATETLFANTSTGQVGIGTVSPTRTLDVNGLIRIRGGSPAANKILISSNTSGDATWSERTIQSLFNKPVTGGGTLTWDGATLAWTQRIIVLPAGEGSGAHFNTAVWGGNTTPTSISIPAWNVAYMRPSDANYSSGGGSYNPLQVSPYNTYVPDAKDIIIAVHNGDNGMLYTAWGVILKAGERYSNTEISYLRNIGIGGTPSYPFHVTTTNSGDWQARFTNGSSNVYFAHQGGYGIHINTGGANSSGRYALEVRNASQTHMYVRDDGNVGVGTTGPAYKLHVAGDVYANGGWFRVSGNQGIYWESWGGGFYMSDATWIRGYNGKNLWMGSGLIGGDGGLTIGYGGASPPSGGAIIAGRTGINNSSPDGNSTLDVKGIGYFGNWGTCASDKRISVGWYLSCDPLIEPRSANFGYVGTSGLYFYEMYNRYYNAASGYYYFSDKSIKQNIRPIESALDKVLKLQGVVFDIKEGTALYNDKDRESNLGRMGFVAQDFQKVLPNAVREVESMSSSESGGEKSVSKGNKLLTVEYTMAVPVLVEAIKEQQEIIKKLEERIKALEQQK